MNFQINTNITVFIDGVNDCYSQQQVYVQWHSMVYSNGNWVLDSNKPARIGVLTSPTNTLSYSAWKALNSTDQLSAVKAFISAQY
jgi:hypothetical protein